MVESRSEDVVLLVGCVVAVWLVLDMQIKDSPLGKGPKIKKRESMVFDHRGGGGGHPKPNPYSELLFSLNFLCVLSFTQFMEKL